MVLVNRNTPMDLVSHPLDGPDPGLHDNDSRMHVLSATVAQMEESERIFFRQKMSDSQSSNGLLSKPSSSILHRSPTSSRPCSHNHPMGKSPSLLHHSVTFSQKHSAMSTSYSSPRQYTLSASTVKRTASGLVDHIRHQTMPNIRLRSITTASTKGFDYDEYEEIPLELLKSHIPPPLYVIETDDIYTRACSYLGITASQTYVKQVTTTRAVTMANTSLSHFTVKPVAISLVRDHRIHTLDISGNDIGGLGVIYIAEMMAVNDTITDLNLSSTNPGRIGLEALAVKLTFNKSLNVLKLEYNSLDHTETDVLVEIIKGCPDLYELYLGHNNLGYDGAIHLAKELEGNTTLRTLDLQWNHFRKQSATHLCNAIKVNQGLRRLNLSWNGLGKEGCAALAKSLPKNTSLKHLDLTNNRIDIVALPFLLHGFVRNKGLETLHLAKNPMTTNGVKAVIRAISGASGVQLKYLNIEDIPVDKDFTNLVKTLKDKRQISVDHGPEMYSAIELTMQEHDPNDLNRFDPVMVIVEYMRIDNLRLIDLFQYFDQSGRGLVSRNDLRLGVSTLGLPLTEYHLDCIMKDVDRKKDGYIDLEEFMIAQRDMSKVIIQRTTKAKKKGKEDLGLKELRKILKDLVEKRNKKNKEKAMSKMNSTANKAKGVNTVTKVKEASQNEAEPPQVNKVNIEMDDIAERSDVIPKLPIGVLKARRSIEREQAFILENSLALSGDSNTLEESFKLPPLELDESLEGPQTLRLPDINDWSRTNNELNDDFTMVDNFLMDTLRTDSSNEVAILGEPIDEMEELNEDLEDVDDFANKTFR